ncbi:cell death abnormality protein 1-like isoform X2 [Littorina saxatilis]|uniref:cell death abnormality protein 1-like isoform X2 n=1 Tax=Littorina saxatilis TaxID=31220 RepID=UPI0038B4C869
MHPACTACAEGYYKKGGKCQQCSSACQNRQCDGVTGECNACPDGRYGNLCAMTCSPGCASCDQQSGNCTTCATNSHLLSPGCTECDAGYYKKTAPSCTPCPGTCYNDTPCDKTTGHCEDCPPGKNGDMCNQECSGGQYGPSRCSLPCGQCQNGTQCHPVTGHCPLCEPGFYPPLCSKRCENKTYGENCSETCGQCKGGQPCDTVTGSCTTGCQPGYTGQLCETECAAGLYGEGCGQVCTNCRVNTTCHHQHGQCLVGCAPGFSGTLCEKPANQNNSLIIPVVSSVIVAGVIIAIAVVGSVCWYRRSRGGPAAKRDTRSTVNEPVNALGDNGTESLGRQPPSSQDDAAYYEISDTANTHEMQEMQNNYDALHPYSNDDADRQPYSQIKSYSSDVTKTSANAVYVNTAFHNVRGTNNM